VKLEGLKNIKADLLDLKSLEEALKSEAHSRFSPLGCVKQNQKTFG
jgi:hypothetical protein